MSLINDALKRVEKSLNDNSQKSQQTLPPYPLEPSKANKKLFFITLIGGTLFFSILILLLFLIFSDTILHPSSQNLANAQSNSATLLANPLTNNNQLELDLVEQSPTHHQTQNNNTLSNASILQESQDTPEPAPNQTHTSTTTNHTPPEVITAKKDLNEEFFESVVNLASKAFIPKTTQAKSTEPTSQTPKENYSLGTAQQTLDMLQQESDQTNTISKSPVQRFLNSLYITGVMISKEDSMVLINNRVYVKNDIINPTLHIKLIDIQPQHIVLKDSSGATYTIEF